MKKVALLALSLAVLTIPSSGQVIYPTIITPTDKPGEILIEKTIDISNVENGWHDFGVRVCDAAGNCSTSSVRLKIQHTGKDKKK
jgi:hypothetical protein